MNDFETVREALSDYLGSLPSAEDWTTPEDDVINAANAALDRIEAEVERLRAELEDTYTQLAGETTKLTNALAQSEAEVERLRTALEVIAGQRDPYIETEHGDELVEFARAALAKEEA